MPDEFRSLASMLRGVEPPQSATDQRPLGAVHVPETLLQDDSFAAETGAALREIRLFKAAVAEGIESAVRALCVDLAAEVLARELQIAPASIDAIVQRLLARFGNEEPLRVRVHPEDTALLTGDLPAFADSSLLRGDAILELRSGEIEATLGVRLQSVLENGL